MTSTDTKEVCDANRLVGLDPIHAVMVDAVSLTACTHLRLAAHLSSDLTACSRGRRVGSEVLAGRPVAGGQGGQQDPGNHRA